MSKQQTILERTLEIDVLPDDGPEPDFRVLSAALMQALAQATEDRFQAEREETDERLKVVEDRCDTLLLQLKNTVDAAIKMGKRGEALEERLQGQKHANQEFSERIGELEARVNTLTAHTDPSTGPDKTSPL